MTFDIFITSNLGHPEVFASFIDDLVQCSLECTREKDEIRLFTDILGGEKESLFFFYMFCLNQYKQVLRVYYEGLIMKEYVM